MTLSLIYAALLATAQPAAMQNIPPHPPGSICNTPYGWCWLPRLFPVGSACFCATPRGPFYGQVI